MCAIRMNLRPSSAIGGGGRGRVEGGGSHCCGALAVGSRRRPGRHSRSVKRSLSRHSAIFTPSACGTPMTSPWGSVGSKKLTVTAWGPATALGVRQLAAMAAASLHPASTAAADCGRGPQIHADCTHRDLLGFSRPSRRAAGRRQPTRRSRTAPAEARPVRQVRHHRDRPHTAGSLSAGRVEPPCHRGAG